MTIPSSSPNSRFDIVYPTAVLFVSHDGEISRSNLEHYESLGIQCAVAYTAQSALRKIEEDPTIGVIVADIDMPEKNGLELLADLRDIYLNTRPLSTILVTAGCGIEKVIEALRLGAFDFKLKPLTPSQLIKCINRATESVVHKTNEKEFNVRLQREVETKTIELMKANRIKSEFLSLINHEIKTPINGIVGFTSLIQSYGETIDHSEHMEMINDIETSAKRLLTTMETVIDISDSISGNISLNYCEVNLSDLITEAVNWQQNKAKTNKINICISGLDKPIITQSDSLRLIQSITYLIDNAIIYSKPDSDIFIHAEENEKTVVVTIRDQGIGMSESEITNALLPFTQIDCGNTRTHEGLGLGLPLARMLIELHNGFLAIESTPNDGTTIKITLPKKVSL